MKRACSILFPSCCYVWSFLVVIASAAVNNDTLVGPQRWADDPSYRVLGDGRAVHFLARPPLSDIRRAGTTAWYPCLAELLTVLDPDSDAPTPTASSLTAHWVIPEGVPRLNHTGGSGGGGGNWSALRGHGYFVDTDRNNTLVLVHPADTDQGRYVCRVQMSGDAASVDAHMQFYVIYYDHGTWLVRTGYGFLGAALATGLIALGWLFHRKVIHPWATNMKMETRKRIPCDVEDKHGDESRLSLQPAST